MRVVKILGEHGNYTVLFEDESWQQSSRLEYQHEVERSAREVGKGAGLRKKAEARRSLGLGLGPRWPPNLCAKSKGLSKSAGVLQCRGVVLCINDRVGASSKRQFMFHVAWSPRQPTFERHCLYAVVGVPQI